MSDTPKSTVEEPKVDEPQVETPRADAPHPAQGKSLKERDEEQDDLDRKIDDSLRRVGDVVKMLVFLAVLGVAGYFIIQKWEEWSQYILFGFYLLFQLMFAILFMIVQFVALFWFLGRPRMYWVMPGETGVGFKDYKGNPEILDMARRIVTLLRGAKHFAEMGGQVHRGLLLIGPPGTGKSYLGQCISTEAGVPFGYLSAPTIQGMFWGMDVLRVWSLYSKARNLARKYGACIVFLDEIDAIAKSRSGLPGMGMGGMMMGGGSAALNQLLTEMDPIPRDSWKDKLLRRLGLRRKKAEQPPVLTMGATNLPEVLDPALVRPGRFDWKLTVDLPSRDGRRELLEYYISKVNHVPDIPMERLADITIGYTPVAIKHVINEAAVIAHFDARDQITYKDFRDAMGTFEWGIKQPIKSMSREEKRRIAYHEAGHAIAQAKLLPRERIEKLTIVRHMGSMSGALGFAATKPKEEMYTRTKEEILAHIQVSLASRAAEQLFLGIEMDGASHDLQSATWYAGALIGLLGMNGTLYSNAAFGQWAPDPSQKRDIERVLDQQFRKVKSFLDYNRDILIALAEELLDKEDMSGEEVYEIIDGVERARNNGHAPEEVPLPEPAELQANPL